MRLQPRLVGATPATFAKFRRVGDATSDLNTAGQALLSDLQSSGCSTSPQADVSAFQTAWNALPPITNPSGSSGIVTTLAVDGKYGPQTQAALQAWADGQGLSVTVPANCFPSSGGGGGTTVTTTTPNGTTTTTQSSLPLTIQQNLTAPWNGLPVWAWLVGAGVLGLALYETRARPRASAMFKPNKRRARRGRAMRRVRRLRRGRRR